VTADDDDDDDDELGKLTRVLNPQLFCANET
jgi:hypothetical protein